MPKSKGGLSSLNPIGQKKPSSLLGSSNQLSGAPANQISGANSNQITGSIKGFGSSLIPGGASKKDPYSFDFDSVPPAKTSVPATKTQPKKEAVVLPAKKAQKYAKQEVEEEMFDEIEIDEDIIEDIDELE